MLGGDGLGGLGAVTSGHLHVEHGDVGTVNAAAALSNGSTSSTATFSLPSR